MKLRLKLHQSDNKVYKAIIHNQQTRPNTVTATKETEISTERQFWSVFNDV